jgi:hypothetical protein
LTYLGLAGKYLADADGKALPSTMTLEHGDSIIDFKFKTLAVPEKLEGQTGAIVAQVQSGGSDTTDYFKFYNRPTYKVDYVPPTTMYAGKLDINLKGGSPNMFRSFNGGITWENAWAPITPIQIENIELKGQLILKEPNSCCDFIIPIEIYEGISPVIRPVTIPRVVNAEIYPPAGVYFIESRGEFVVTIRPTGANAGLIPVLATNRTSIPDSEGVELKEVVDGAYTFVIYRVQQELQLKVDFVSPSASVPVNGTEVWGDRGQLHLASPLAGEVKIYGITGRLIQSFTLPSASRSSIALPAGVYLVRLNGTTYRIAVK